MLALLPFGGTRPQAPRSDDDRARRPRLSAIGRAGVVIAVALVATMAVPTAPASANDPAEGETGEEPIVRDLVFPAVGPMAYTDTWGACRGFRCSRRHKGADLFGVKLAPLVAAADGTVTSIRRTALTNAGNTIIIEDDEGWRYLYLHLNNDTPGTDDGANPQGWIVPNRIRVGDRVSAGEVIGYLGDSGNAETTPAHLHFELHHPELGAINPTPSLDEARAAGRVVPVVNLASTGPGRAEHVDVIAAWYRALLKREPSPAELFAWADRFDIEFANRDDLIADLTMAPERRDPAGTVLRAYRVVLDRRPDLDGLRAAERAVADGASSADLAAALLASDEFAAAHGELDDAAFIDIIYENARGRAPSDPVRQYWAGQLAAGRERADMARYFIDSFGLKSATWHSLEVQQAFRAALDRLPTDEEHRVWVAHLDGGGQIVDVVDAIRHQPAE